MNRWQWEVISEDHLVIELGIPSHLVSKWSKDTDKDMNFILGSQFDLVDTTIELQSHRFSFPAESALTATTSSSKSRVRVPLRGAEQNFFNPRTRSRSSNDHLRWRPSSVHVGRRFLK